MRGALSGITFFAKGLIFPVSPIDCQSDTAYIAGIGYGGKAMSDFALGYSLPITEPRCRKEGLMNFIQMIINAAERGDVHQAIYLAVDLKDTISGNANPYAHVTDGFTAEAVSKEIEEARRQMEIDKNAAVAKAFQDGAAHARAEILRQLQVV